MRNTATITATNLDAEIARVLQAHGNPSLLERLAGLLAVDLLADGDTLLEQASNQESPASEIFLADFIENPQITDDGSSVAITVDCVIES